MDQPTKLIRLWVAELFNITDKVHIMITVWKLSLLILIELLGIINPVHVGLRAMNYNHQVIDVY